MLKAIEQLVKGQRTCVGNHRSNEYTNRKGETITAFIYHSTAICKVNSRQRTFTIDNGGYNTQSTNRAISNYRYYFEGPCFYTEVFENFNLLTETMVVKSCCNPTSYRCYYGLFDSPMYEVTLTTRTLVDEKFAEVTISNQLSGEIVSETFKYKGAKTFENEFRKLESKLVD